MQRVTNPVPIFLSRDGSLLDAGKVYFGVAGMDPETNPVQVYWDVAGTIPADQPLLTLGGVIVNESIPAFAYVSEADYSQKVSDAFNVQITYSPSLQDDVAYQPLDADLTAIAALATTAYGRNLLTVANSTELATATGVPAALPLTGGAVTGNILRQGAGGHLYWMTAGMLGRAYLTQTSAGDPTSQAGDVWMSFA